MRISPICQVLPKLQGFEHQLAYATGNKLAPLCLRIPNLADRNTKFIYCFSFAKFYQPRVETYVKLATKVSCPRLVLHFEKFSFLSEMGTNLKLAK